MLTSRLALEMALALNLSTPPTVSVDLEEYLKLVEKSKETPIRTPSGSEVLITQADYLIELGSPDDSVAKVSVGLDLHNFDGKPQWLPLFRPEWTLGVAEQGKSAADLSFGDDQTWIHAAPGRTQVKLAAYLQASADSDDTPLFAFQLPLAGAQTVRFRAPLTAGMEYGIEGATIVGEKDVGGKREYTLRVPPGSEVSIASRPELKKVDVLPAMLEVEASHVLVAGEQFSQLTTIANVDVRFTGMTDFSYHVPAGWRVVDVQGEAIRRWHQTGDNLSIALTTPLLGQSNYTIKAQGPAGEASSVLQTKLIQPIGAAHVTGWVGVATEPAFELSESSLPAAVARVDVRALPEDLRNQSKRPLVLAYRYFDSDPELHMKLRALESVDLLVTLADRIDATSVLTREGRQLTVVRYQIRNNRKQYLEVTLPKGAALWSTTVAEQAVRPSTGAQGSLLIPLLRSQVAGGAVVGFQVEVAYVEERPALRRGWFQHWEAALPKIDVSASYASWQVYLPEEVKVNRRRTRGTLELVPELGQGVAKLEEMTSAGESAQMEVEASSQAQLDDTPATGDVPIAVRLPKSGNVYSFERVLPASDPLNLRVRYRMR